MPSEPWRRNRLAISIATALFYGGLTAVMPFLPYYVEELGVRGEGNVASWSGLLITLGPLLSALVGPIWGRLGDRYGMKLMVERCALAQALHWLLFAFAQSVHHLLALRILIGLFGGFTGVAVPLLASTTPREHLSRSIGGLQTVQMLSSAMGPLFGGLLADAIGVRYTCLVSAVLTLLATVLIRMLFKESPTREPAPGSNAKRAFISLRGAVALPGFGIMMAVTFFVTFVERSFSPIVALYVLKLGTSLSHASKTAGLIISLGLLSEAVAAGIMGKSLRTVSAKTLLRWRLVGGALACLPMGLVWTTSQFLVLRLVLGFLAGGCIVVVYTLAIQTIPQEIRGTSFSFLAGAALLGGAAGPIVAGELAHVSLRAIFFFDSGIFLLLFVLAWKRLQAASPPPQELAAKDEMPLAVRQ